MALRSRCYAFRTEVSAKLRLLIHLPEGIEMREARRGFPRFFRPSFFFSIFVDTMGCGSSKEVALAPLAHPQLPVTNREEKTRDAMIVPQRPLEESPKLTINDFELMKTVGKGSFGRVFQAWIVAAASTPRFA